MIINKKNNLFQVAISHCFSSIFIAVHAMEIAIKKHILLETIKKLENTITHTSVSQINVHLT